MQLLDVFDNIAAELIALAADAPNNRLAVDEQWQHTAKKEWQEKKQHVIPRVMLFGSYNAGKSTLINALLKQELAKVADIPTTAQVEEYPWLGCFLQDSPGINAPIEHEAVTNEQVERSDLLLFVIREGDQDVSAVYERLFALLNNNKSLFIVYNHQLQAAELEQGLTKLNHTLLDYAAKCGVADEVIRAIPVSAVNVKTALKASIENKQNLAEHAGLVAFQQRFETWLTQFDNERHYIESLRQFIRTRLLSPLLQTFSDDADSPDADKRTQLQNELEIQTQHFELMQTDVSYFVRKTVTGEKERIESCLISQPSQAQLETQIQSVATLVFEKTAEYVQKRCEEFEGQLTDGVEANAITPESTPSAKAEALNQAAIAGLKRVDKAAIKEGLLLMRKFKVPFIKGRWGTTLDKWAGRAAPVLTVALTAYQIFSEANKQDKENQAKRRYEMAIYQAVSELSDEICNTIITAVNEQLNRIQQQVTAQSQQALNELIAALGRQDKVKAQLHAIEFKLQQLRAVDDASL